MNDYDDYAINPSNFEQMASEYNLQKQKIFSLTKKCEIDKSDVNSLFEKTEYLKTIVLDLEARTKNGNILLVLKEILEEVESSTKNLSNIFDDSVKTYQTEQFELVMFCNNLKLAINIVGEIIKLLIKIKDDDIKFEYSQVLTNEINRFIDINNKLASMFGECRYLKYIE